MTEVATLLAAFHEATGREAAIWERRDGTVALSLLGASSSEFAALTETGALVWDVNAWACQRGLSAQLVNTGESAGWLFAEPGLTPESNRLLGRLVPFVRRLASERDGAARELVERYQEINLLYAIGELLGGGAAVEDVADTLLYELATTVGATRAVFLLTRRAPMTLAPMTLAPVATLGLRDREYVSIALDDPAHIAVRAWRAGGACMEDDASSRLADPLIAEDGGPLLAVAISRPNTGVNVTGQFPVVSSRRVGTPQVESMGATPSGVLVLGGRAHGAPFTAGDRKLAMAVGTQIGVAMHNASLVRAAVERQQLVREMRVAHELQLKLLPKPSVVEPEARAAARVVSAESVGGDFFLLARLDRDRTGVLIGDVSGHGFQAALVMALALSAAAIHVQAAFDPSIALEAVQRSLADELASTEMSLSLCYAVIDSRVGELRFANAGHPHAFRLGADGVCERLSAVVPPIGFSNVPIDECVMAWRQGDRLVLFTDGLVDALDARDQRLGEAAMLRALSRMSHAESPDKILAEMFAVVTAHAGETPLRDDQAVVVVDRPW